MTKTDVLALLSTVPDLSKRVYATIMYLLIPNNQPGFSDLTPEDVAEVMGIDVEHLTAPLKQLEKVGLVHGADKPNMHGTGEFIFTAEHDAWDDVSDGWEQIDPVKRYGIHPGFRYN